MNSTPMLDCNAERFLKVMQGRTFSYIGAALLIRAHLLITETNRLKPIQIDHILHINTTYSRDLIDQVLAGSFERDSEGYIFSASVDRMVGRYVPEGSPV